jgi:two-component system response regulator AlgR
VPVQILLVDDDSALRFMARHLLHGELVDVAHEITEASTGPAALSVCAEMHIDLVVLDLHMPGFSGHSVLEVLKEGPDSPCVIAWSADDAALAVAVREGADQVVPKNGDVNLLVAAVYDCLPSN